MLRIIIKLLSFINSIKRLATKKRKPFTSSLAEKSNVSYRLYSGCDDLPLLKFEDCLCDENYQSLVIEGNPPARVISERWLEIYSEFIDLSHETDAIAIKNLQFQMIVLTARIEKIKTCVNYLMAYGSAYESAQHNKLAVEVATVSIDSLRKLGYKYKYDPKGKTYYTDLKMVLSRSITWEVQLELKESQYEEYMSKNNGEPVSRNFFTRYLVSIQQLFKVSLNKNDLKVSEYCFWKRDFVSRVNKLNTQTNTK